MKKIILGLALLASTSSVMADQCSYISKAQAQKALTTVMNADSVESLCEPCGETKAVSVKVKSLGISDVDYKGFWALDINGKKVDLAYTFVNGMNLSKIAGCASQSVSASIRKD